jgi:glycosyltransferase involved in cell wall biosynthesis
MLAQSCEDFEILLIDDGSSDGSGELCDRYGAEHPNKIKVIHQENGGAGEARNNGIRQAKGSYLLFVDSDDYLSDRLLADLREAIQKTPAQLYLFGALVERDGKLVEELHEAVPANRVLTVSDAPSLYFGVAAPWNKAYHRSLFSETGITFASKVWYEDLRVTVKVLAAAQSVVRLEGAYYHYLQREGSAMRNTNSGRNAEIIEAFDDILDWFRTQGFYARYSDELCFLAISHMLIAASVRVLLIDPKHPLPEVFRAYIERHFPNYQNCRYLPLLDKNKTLIYKLLLKKRYRSVKLLFRLKELLGR